MPRRQRFHRWSEGGMPVSVACARLADEHATIAARELGTAITLAAVGQDWGSVYWHAGFAVENILKAIRVKNDGLEVWPDGDRSGKWHDLGYIVERAGVRERLRHERRNRAFASCWLATKDWDQGRRYPGNPVTRNEAMDLLNAIRNPTHGVMRCLSQLYQNI